MNHFRAIGTQLFYSFPIQVQEQCKLDAYLDLLESSGVWNYLSSVEKVDSQNGRPSYDPYALFAVILLDFSIGQAYLREIETSCKNDLRFIYVAGGVYPSYFTISRFIQEVIAPQKEKIFACICRAASTKKSRNSFSATPACAAAVAIWLILTSNWNFKTDLLKLAFLIFATIQFFKVKDLIDVRHCIFHAYG